MAQQALGMIETKGLCPLFEATDAALKAANVTFTGWEKIGSGYVTAFFRDTAAWDVVTERVIPELLEHKPAPAPIRLWSAGCASGEEAYTLAMLLVEAMGEIVSRSFTLPFSQ